MQQDYVKKCTFCKLEMSIEDIISDPKIKPIGMTFIGDTPETIFYFFNHDIGECGTTFAIKVSELIPYVEEPIPNFNLLGTSACCGHCTSIEDLSDCHNECHNAPFRRFMFRMFDAKKRRAKADRKTMIPG